MSSEPERSRERVLALLSTLVGIDSQNPPRCGAPIVDALERALGGGFAIQRTDLGGGSIALLATRGAPRVVFNAHVDTVPVVPGWTRDPFHLVVSGDRAFGLGACDTKGAAAALITAAHACRDDVALLFTTDEEAGDARCARWFASEPRGFDAVVVAEPTNNRAVLAHRGVGSARITFRGESGHSSTTARRSANHALVTWAARALRFAEERARAGLDVRFNLGRIDGGEKPNVIAGTAEARFGVRPPPGMSPADLLDALIELAPEDAVGQITFVGEALPARMHREAAARELAHAWGIPVGEPVDFWTEAAVFSTVVPAIVYGPGQIEQAHGADEWVSCAALERAVDDYVTAFRRLPEALS